MSPADESPSPEALQFKLAEQLRRDARRDAGFIDRVGRANDLRYSKADFLGHMATVLQYLEAAVDELKPDYRLERPSALECRIGLDGMGVGFSIVAADGQQKTGEAIHADPKVKQLLHAIEQDLGTAVSFSQKPGSLGLECAGDPSLLAANLEFKAPEKFARYCPPDTIASPRGV